MSASDFENTRNEAQGTATRRFSAEYTDQIASLRNQVKTSRTLPESELDGLLNAIWNEAAFLGCPAVARLSRNLLPAEKTNETAASGEIVETFDEALATLTELLETPTESELVSKADRCCERLTELGYATKPRYTFDKLPPAKTSPSTTAPTADANVDHTDVSIYSNEAIDGLEQCTQEESWLVSQLAAAAEDLASGRHGDRSAHHLMHILSGHRFFRNVDRVCVVGLMPATNQLVVVDSALSARMKEAGVRNHMQTGYSCFVNPDGSLARMRPGVLRVFADSNAVLDSYAREEKPAQRSIAYISESGLRSGICLAIGRGENLQGYLFLNSCEADLFHHIRQDYGSVLSLFSVLATVALDGAGFHGKTDTRWNAAGVPQHSTVFARDEFERFFGQALRCFVPEACAVNVQCENDLAFLYCPASVLLPLGELAFRSGLIPASEANTPLQIVIEQRANRVEFRLLRADFPGDARPNDWLQQRVSELATTLLGRPIEVRVDGGQTPTLSIPYEPTFAGDSPIRYSVAY